MKKLVLKLFVMCMCVTFFAGCTSDTESLSTNSARDMSASSFSNSSSSPVYSASSSISSAESVIEDEGVSSSAVPVDESPFLFPDPRSSAGYWQVGALQVDESEAPFLPGYYQTEAANNQQPLQEIDMQSLLTPVQNGLKCELRRQYHDVNYRLQNGGTQHLTYEHCRSDLPEDIEYNVDSRLVQAIDGSAHIATVTANTAGHQYSADISSAGYVEITQTDVVTGDTESLAKLGFTREASIWPLDIITAASGSDIVLAIFEAWPLDSENQVNGRYGTAQLWLSSDLTTTDVQYVAPDLDGALVYTLVIGDYAYLLRSFDFTTPLIDIDETEDLTTALRTNQDTVENISLNHIFKYETPVESCWTYENISDNQAIDNILLLSSINLNNKELNTKCIAGVFGSTLMTERGLFISENRASSEAALWHAFTLDGEYIQYNGTVSTPEETEFQEELLW